MKLHLVTLFLAFLCSQMAFSQTEPQSSWRKQPLFKYDPSAREMTLQQSDLENIKYYEGREFSDLIIENGGNGKGELFIPLEATPSMIGLAAATSLGLIVFKNDQQIMDYVQSTKDSVPQGLVNFGNIMGTKDGMAPLILGSYFLAVVIDNDKLKKVGLITVAAQIATGIVTEAFKLTFERMRPRDSANNPYQFFVEGGEHKSFFSGHSSAAWTLATVISEAYGKDHPVVPYLAYGMAAITSYARINSHAHWGTDVILGAIAGHLIGKIVYYVFENGVNNVDKKQRWLSVRPGYDFKSGGVKVTVNYTPKKWRPRPARY